MQVTQRDVAILKFINEFGFCEIRQIEKQFGIKKARTYKIMQRLVKGGLMNHKRVFYGQHGVFYLSIRGARYTDLPVIKNIPTSTYDHQLSIVEIYIKLIQQYPDADWVSERRLKHEKFTNGVGKRGKKDHLADGMLIFPDQKKIAVEVELTLKSKDRLSTILRGYAAQFSIDEVWYYCSEKVLPMVSKLAGEKQFIKVYALDELLAMQ